VHQAPDERNFHIFYNLLAGASPEEKAKFKLTKAQDYAYTNKSGCFTAKGIEDELDYDRVKVPPSPVLLAPAPPNRA